MEDVPGPKSKCPPYEFYRFQRFTPKSRWLMAQRVFRARSHHPELKEVIYCTNCLMWELAACVTMGSAVGHHRRDARNDRDGHEPRPILEGLQRTTIRGAAKTSEGFGRADLV
jgi:hypothetical protein